MSEPPDLTERYLEAVSRLRSACIGNWTLDDFVFARAQISDYQTTRFQVFKSFEGMPIRRDPEAELAIVERLERLAR